MEKRKKLISIMMILIIITYSFLTVFFQNTSFAVNQTISTEINKIDNKKYPGIADKIKSLQSKYPNWKFKILYTGLEWNQVIANEYMGHGSSPKNLVYKSSNYGGEWICSICKDQAYDNGSWRCASEKAIKYMIDPRTSLNETDIFQFEELTNSGCDINTLKVMTKGTFLEGHEQGIINAANNNNVNAYYIVARLIQEQGNNGTVLTKGNGYNGEYIGYYNAFNIAASGNSTSAILLNALSYAKKKGWTTLDSSIDGGISFLAKQYIQKGQNTLYLQKFDVESTNGLYSNQYMQNILAAQSEGAILKSTYVKMNSVSSEHTFIIPVYENMPADDSKKPNTNVTNSTNNTNEDLVKVNVEGSLRIRNTPNGSSTVGYLYANEIITRLEKATSKVNGTYWDKVKKSDGTTGYAARETYENESKYKLYLVPINENKDTSNSSNNANTTNTSNTNNSNNTSSVGVDTVKVKINNSKNIITVTPNTIAFDILNAFGGIAKITKADKSFLNNGNDLMCTGFIVEDKYTVVKKGDANSDGVVNSFDYIRIMNYIMGTKTLTDAEKEAADANLDGTVNSFDYIRIMNYIMGNKNIEI